jgi:hypothetical protein
MFLAIVIAASNGHAVLDPIRIGAYGECSKSAAAPVAPATQTGALLGNWPTGDQELPISPVNAVYNADCGA